MKLTILWDRLASYSSAFFRELAAQGCELQLIHIAPGGELPFGGFDLAFCREHHEVRDGFPPDLARRVDAFAPDCLLISGWKFPQYLAIARGLRARGVPVIAGVDNPWRGDLRQVAASIVSRWLLRPAIDAMYVAGQSQAVLARHLGFEDVFEGLYSADTQPLAAIGDYRSRENNFLFVGRLIERKGIDLLLEAYQRYRGSAARPMGLIVAGTGAYEAQCRATAGVEVRGFVQPAELPHLLGRAQCFVLPSRWDHWGVAIHEAAAAGLPVIATRTCGATERFVVDDASGFVIPPSAEALAEALRRFDAAPVERRDAMSRESRRLALLWTPQRQASEFLGHARRLAAQRAAARPPPLTLRDFWTLRYSAGGHALTRMLSQRVGAVIAWVGLRLGLSPNLMTLVGTGLFVVATALYAKLPGGWGPALLCLLLFQLAYGVDCADGQLARATKRTSTFGAWLDIACDFFRIVLLGSALIMWLLFAHTRWLVTMLASGLFMSGMAIQLHTVTILRQAAPGERLETRGLAQRLRAAVTASFDTATVLALLALLREWPPLLALYAGALGTLSILSSVYLASRRLRPT